MVFTSAIIRLRPHLVAEGSLQTTNDRRSSLCSMRQVSGVAFTVLQDTFAT